MSSEARDTISNPEPGLLIFNTSLGCLEIYRTPGWYCLDATGYHKQEKYSHLIGGFGEETAVDIRPTTDGGHIIAGTSYSSLSGDVGSGSHGYSDYWIARLDSNGILLWNKLLGGDDYEFASGLTTTDDDGSLLVGYTRSSQSGDIKGTAQGFHNSWIVRLDPDGRILWEKLLGGARFNEIYSVLNCPDGGFLLGGHSNAFTIESIATNGGYDYWFVKISDQGEIVWQTLIGGNDHEFLQKISLSEDGGYLASGRSSSSSSGDVSAFSHGSSDYWIVKLDTIGNIIWNSLLGGSDSDFPIGILGTSDGGSIVVGGTFSSASGNVTGTTNGGIDVWVVKLNKYGVIEWDQLIGGIYSDLGVTIQEANDGGYLLAASSGSSESGDVTPINHGGGDIWIVKLNADGTIAWNRLLGGEGHETTRAIYKSQNGGYTIIGHSNSSQSGDVTDVSNGGYDIWVVEIDSTGSVRE